MTTKQIIRSQYQSALEMLKGVITQCPEDLWANTKFKNQSWQIAYHALFYTHLYLQITEEDFIPWEKHHENIHRFTPAERTSQELQEAYTKGEMLEYLEYCRKEIDRKVAELDLEAESGFYWLPFNKGELQFYNIRHLQHHTGELFERLGTNAGIELNWVGRMPVGQS